MDTRDEILRAGLNLMNRYGYGSISLTSLASEAKITKQLVYYYFRSMDEILMVLAEKWSQTGQQCALESLAETQELGAMKIIAIGSGMFRWMKDNQELSRLGLVIYQSSPHLKNLDVFMASTRIKARERISSILNQEKTFSSLSKIQIEKVVTAIHSILYGFYFYVIVMNDFKNLKSHEENCEQSLRRLIASYLK